MRRKPFAKTWLALLCFGLLVACDQIIEANRTAQYEAASLARGNAALAACIAAECEVLDIDGMWLENFSVLNALPHVTVLMASRSNLASLEDISGMPQLKELHITRSDVTDLTGLKYLPQLTVLHIESAPVDTDFSPVAQLSGLKELAIGDLDSRTDASFIQNMRQLENLLISWRGDDADLSVLRGHPSLKNIVLNGPLPADQSALLSMPRLESIMINDDYSLDPAVRDALDNRGVLRVLPPVVVC